MAVAGAESPAEGLTYLTDTTSHQDRRVLCATPPSFKLLRDEEEKLGEERALTQLVPGVLVHQKHPAGEKSCYNRIMAGLVPTGAAGNSNLGNALDTIHWVCLQAHISPLLASLLQGSGSVTIEKEALFRWV